MKGAIFDVDGTLLDSMSVWEDVTYAFFQERGLSLSNTLAQQMQEMTLEESIPLLRRTYGLTESTEEITGKLKEKIVEAYRTTIPLKPYVREYLQLLKSRKISMAIATSGYQELCEAALRRLGVWDCFNALAFSSEVGVNKSNPDIYLLAARRLGIAPGDCMVYEDICAGLTGAKKAGMKTTAVYDKTNEAVTEALKSLADRYITSWKDLL